MNSELKRGISQIVVLSLAFCVGISGIIFLRQRLILCHNQAWLQQLSDDSKTDFYLMGKYYCLPCKLEQFLDNGFTINQGAEVIAPGARCNVIIEKDGYQEECIVINETMENLTIEKAAVVRICFHSNGNIFSGNNVVIKRGINLLTPVSVISKVMRDIEGYSYHPGSPLEAAEFFVMDGETVRIHINPREWLQGRKRNRIELSVMSDGDLKRFFFE